MLETPIGLPVGMGALSDTAALGDRKKERPAAFLQRS
jgi:hypothetical protein